MVNSSKDSRQFEEILSIPKQVWNRICKAGLRQTFLDEVLHQNDTFIFDIEHFCEQMGITLSKAERALCKEVVEKSGKYVKPRLVK